MTSQARRGEREARRQVESLTAPFERELADSLVLQRVSAALIQEDNVEAVYDIVAATLVVVCLAGWMADEDMSLPNRFSRIR